MPSTYTTNGGIEKIATGEQSGSWGDTTNLNFDIIDRITNGVGSIALSGTSSNLQTTDGALSDGQFKVLVFGGSPSGTHTVTILPNDAQKLYFVKNSTSQTIIFDQGSGSNVNLPAGKTDIIYCDGGGAAGAVASLITELDLSDYLQAANNLNDLTNTTQAILNLGITATVDELNIMDGVTATTEQINILSGVTATATELNYNDIVELGTSEASKVVTADANGDVKFSNSVIETVYSMSGLDIDPNNGSIQTKAITENTEFVDSLTSGESVTLQITSASSYQITWPTMTWISRIGNYAPTLTAAYTISLFKVGGTLYGIYLGSYV